MASLLNCPAVVFISANIFRGCSLFASCSCLQAAQLGLPEESTHGAFVYFVQGRSKGMRGGQMVHVLCRNRACCGDLWDSANSASSEEAAGAEEQGPEQLQAIKNAVQAIAKIQMSNLSAVDRFAIKLFGTVDSRRSGRVGRTDCHTLMKDMLELMQVLCVTSGSVLCDNGSVPSQCVVEA